MATLNDQHKPICPQEQIIYEHLLQRVKSESPFRLVEGFRDLFFEGVGYSDPEVLKALQGLLESKRARDEFRYILNRCCHILINHWQLDSQAQSAIPELLDLFESFSPSGVYARHSPSKRLHGLIGDFKDSEQYLTLRRLSQVMGHNADRNENPGSRPLGTLIRQYPYLYSHCLLSEDSNYEQQQTVRQLQAQQQRKYEVNLSQYVTYQVRRAQVARQTSPERANRILKPVKNPTLLSDRELYVAVKQFVGRAEGSHTYRDLAQSFLTHSSQTQTYRAFKDDFYEYLVSSVDSEYGKRKFNDRLYQQLKNTLPQSDSQKLSDFLIVRTCSQLLNFLVVESAQRPNHFVFIDLISNIGPTLMTALLLKIVLICRKVKPYLEKRFSIMFGHYESSSREATQWLIAAMENVNIALSTHFGSVDLSFLGKAST